VIPAEEGQVFVCCLEEERVPKAEDESRGKYRLPSGIFPAA